MKTHMKRSAAMLAILLLIALPASGGEIPKGYRGVYASIDKRIRMELKESKATLDISGILYRADVEREDSAKIYEQLSKGRPYVYIQNPARGQNVLDVFWVTPELATQKAVGGLVAYRAHVLYMRLNREQPSDVPSIKIVFSKDGMVLLDAMTRRWQVGWGTEFAEHEMVRAASTRN
jgi:hypothetical protein